MLQKLHSDHLLFDLTVVLLKFRLQFLFINIVGIQELLQFFFPGFPAPPFFWFFPLSPSYCIGQSLINGLQFLILFFQAKELTLSLLIFLFSDFEAVDVLIELSFQVFYFAFELVLA